MRVHMMMRRRGAAADEQGAVAIVVAISLVVLLGISAFAVDFGLAFSNKRQLQTSADSAALAAAASLADEPIGCYDTVAMAGVADGDPPIVNDPFPPIKDYAQLDAEAQTAGDAYMEANHSGATYVPGSMTFECQAGAIHVSWANDAPSNAGLGGVFGRDEILSTRPAVAALDVPPGTATGLRPFPFCSKYVPFTSLPSQVWRVEGPYTGGNDGNPDQGANSPVTEDPGCPEPGGNWYQANCPGTTNNGVSVLGEAVLNGCSTAVNQVLNPTPDVPDDDGLEAACPPMAPNDPLVPDDCLNADPGNFNVQLASDWRTVMNRREPIVIPVFCGTPPCSPDPAVVEDAGGNNVDYPIYRMMSVQICGFHFGNSPNKRGQIFDGPCADANHPAADQDTTRNAPTPFRDTEGNNQTNYFLVVFRSGVVGPVFGASGCTIGDPSCDGGLRRTTLVE